MQTISRQLPRDAINPSGTIKILALDRLCAVAMSRGFSQLGRRQWPRAVIDQWPRAEMVATHAASGVVAIVCDGTLHMIKLEYAQ
jgi:hypothetical protein